MMDFCRNGIMNNDIHDRGSPMTRHARLPLLSVEAYLEGERTSDIRHKYVAGRVFARMGSTLGHNRIALN